MSARERVDGRGTVRGTVAGRGAGGRRAGGWPWALAVAALLGAALAGRPAAAVDPDYDCGYAYSNFVFSEFRFFRYGFGNETATIWRVAGGRFVEAVLRFECESPCNMAMGCILPPDFQDAVAVESSRPDILPVPSTVALGATSTFVAMARPVDEPTEVVVTASWEGQSRQANLTVLPCEDPAPGVPLVRIVYLVPSDRTVREDYRAALARAARNFKMWLAGPFGIGGGMTFSLRCPVVEVVETPHEAAWYSTHDSGGDSTNRFWDNVLADAFDLTGGDFNDPANRWAYYIDADPACGQVTGGTSAVALMPANDLRGLVGEANVPPCAGDPPDNAGPCRWVGGLGHELLHAFYVPHPPGCDDGLPECDEGSLMWTGFRDYPISLEPLVPHLRPSDRDLLLDDQRNAAFFTDQGFFHFGGMLRGDCERLDDPSIPLPPINRVPFPHTAGGPYVTLSSAPKVFQLDASGSTDPDGDALEFLWETDCAGAVIADPESATTTLQLDPAAGDQVCSVTVTVSDGEQTASRRARVIARDDIVLHAARDALAGLGDAARTLGAEYTRRGITDGLQLTGAIAEQGSRVDLALAVLDGEPLLEARPVLDAATALAGAAAVIDSNRLGLEACSLCNLGPGSLDGLAREADRIEVGLGVIGELLPLALAGGEPHTHDLADALDAAAADLLAVYRAAGHAQGSALATRVGGEARDLAAAFEAAFRLLETEDLGPQNAAAFLDAINEVSAAVETLEQSRSDLEICCQLSPGLVAPLGTLVAHARAQAGALGDAVVDRIPADAVACCIGGGQPVENIVAGDGGGAGILYGGGQPIENNVVPDMLFDALADGKRKTGALARPYRILGDSRGQALAEQVASDLVRLETLMETYNAAPSVEALDAVSTAFDGIEGQVNKIEECCLAVPGILSPVRHALSRIALRWARLGELRLSGIIYELGPQNATVPPITGAHWAARIGDLADEVGALESLYRGRGSPEGAAVAAEALQLLADLAVAVDGISGEEGAGGGASSHNDLSEVLEVLDALGAAIARLGECCGFYPRPLHRIAVSVEIMRIQAETLREAIIGEVGPFLRRGDPNGDGSSDISDGIIILLHLFRGHPEVLGCADAADGNDDGAVNIADATYILNFLFRGGTRPPPPFDDCGEDPSDDPLECRTQPLCDPGAGP